VAATDGEGYFHGRTEAVAQSLKRLLQRLVTGDSETDRWWAQRPNESFAETMAWSLGVGTSELRQLIVKRRLGSGSSNGPTTDVCKMLPSRDRKGAMVISMEVQ
jgi:hypothetical protein